MDKDLNLSQIEENLRNWFKEKWVRFGPDGKIRGECARGDEGEGKPKCLPQAKAHSLGKKGRASAASRKRREDPDAERRGPAKNVATKKKSNESVTEGAYEKSEKNKRAAQAAQQQGDEFAYHMHMAEYYDNLAQWSSERGRHSLADRYSEKSEGHHEQAMSLKEQTVAEGRHFKTSYGYAGGSKPSGGTYKHPEQIKADQEAKKKAREQENNKQQGVASDTLSEFAPPGSNDGDDGFSEETLKRLAAEWWNGDEDPSVERTLAAAGWEIGQDEGYDNGGVFVVQAGDEDGGSYISWPAEELEQLQEQGMTKVAELNESLKTHYQNGYNAQKKGRARQDNPHREGTPAAAMWAKGWEHSSDNKDPQKFANEAVDSVTENWLSYEQIPNRWAVFPDSKKESVRFFNTYGSAHDYANKHGGRVATIDQHGREIKPTRASVRQKDVKEQNEKSPMYKDAVLQDRVRSLRNLISIYQEKGRRNKVQELKIELKTLLISMVSKKHNLGSAELNLLTIPELEDLLKSRILEQRCPECQGPIFHEALLEGKDACYYKVKSRYKVWPSAYASGALVKCRKKGAKNWGNKSESVTHQAPNVAVSESNNENLEEALGAFLGGLFRGAAPTVARQAPTTAARQATATASKNVGKKLDKLGTVGGVTAALAGSGSDSGGSSITTYCVIDSDGNQVACYPTSEEAQNYLNSLPNRQGYTIQSRLEESQIKNINKKLYYKISYTSEDALINEFKMQKDKKGWFLPESASNKSKLEALRTFGLPIMVQEGYEPAAGTGGTSTIGSDNTVSPVGSIPKSQRINNKKQGTKNG